MQPKPDQKLSSLKIGTTWSLPPGWTRLGCGCHREKVQSSQSLPWSQRDSVDDVLGKKINCFIFSIQFPPGTTFHLLPGTQEDHRCRRCKRSFPFRLWTNKCNVSWYIFQSHHFIPWSSKWLIASLYLPPAHCMVGWIVKPAPWKWICTWNLQISMPLVDMFCYTITTSR